MYSTKRETEQSNRFRWEKRTCCKAVNLSCGIIFSYSILKFLRKAIIVFGTINNTFLLEKYIIKRFWHFKYFHFENKKNI